MRKLRWNIALLVGGSVLLLLLIILGGYNLIMRRWIATNANSSLQASLLSESADVDSSFFYSPEMITVFAEQPDTENDPPLQFYTPKMRSVLEWSEGQAAGTTLKADIGGSSFYVLIADEDMLGTDDNTSGGEYENGGYVSMVTVDTGKDNGKAEISVHTGPLPEISRLIGYVVITGELEVIRTINLVFLLAAVVIGMLGSTMGYFIGRKLEQNQLAQKQFFENTSHELKTPLTSIYGYAEGIEKGIITDYPRTGRIIANQTEKMSRLVEEILCMAKLESGTVRLERESVSMPELLQNCLMPFEGTVLSRGLDVSLDLQPMTVSADPDKLEHAVTNLLTNALKYAKTKITVSSGDGKVCIANDCEAIPDDTLSHLFERFYTGRAGNTGIGLSLAKELIELHGWRLSAYRTDAGICFEICCANQKASCGKRRK